MDISKKNLRNNLFYEKSPQPFNSSDKEKISLLTTRIESYTRKGEIRQKVIFYRNDVYTKDFINNQSKYITDRASTIAHLQNELSKSNKFNPNQIQLFIKNIHSDIAVMKDYSPEQNEISNKAMEANDDFEEFADFIKVCKQFKAANEKYSELPLSIREKNEGISSDDLNYTPNQEKTINYFNYLNLKYENYLKFFDNKFDKDIWKNKDALNTEKNIRFHLANSTQKENEEMKLDAHKSSEKIDYLKASLFEDNLKIFKIKKKNIVENGFMLQFDNSEKPNKSKLRYSSPTTTTANSPRNNLSAKQIKNLNVSFSTNSPNLINNQNSITTQSEKLASSNSNSTPEKKSIETITNQSQPEKRINSHSAQDAASSSLRPPIGVNSTSLPIPRPPPKSDN